MKSLVHQHPNTGPFIPRRVQYSWNRVCKSPAALEVWTTFQPSWIPLSGNEVPERGQGRDKTTGDMQRDFTLFKYKSWGVT